MSTDDGHIARQRVNTAAQGRHVQPHRCNDRLEDFVSVCSTADHDYHVHDLHTHGICLC